MRVAVNGASGGVGTFAVQLAKAHGAAGHRRVPAPASSTWSARSAPTQVVDHTREDFTRAAAPYDVIIDIAGQPLAARLPAGAPSGRHAGAGRRPAGEVHAADAGGARRRTLVSEKLLPLPPGATGRTWTC